jgi:hypothetical protein
VISVDSAEKRRLRNIRPQSLHDPQLGYSGFSPRMVYWRALGLESVKPNLKPFEFDIGRKSDTPLKAVFAKVLLK